MSEMFTAEIKLCFLKNAQFEAVEDAKEEA